MHAFILARVCGTVSNFYKYSILRCGAYLQKYQTLVPARNSHLTLVHIFSAVPDPFNFFSQSYNVIPFSDYEQQYLLSNHIRNTVINATRRVICYDQPIYDDMRLEVSEYFGMTLTVQSMPHTTVLTEVQPMYDQVAILILDDDGKQCLEKHIELPTIT